VLESLACGTPVIASDVGSLACTLTDGVDSLLFPVGDAAALADRIARLLDEPALRARLSRGARATAVNRHAPERHVASLMALFARVATPRQADVAETPLAAPLERVARDQAPDCAL
jgi:glycosyltransferase involved in cell wall biosynthesis